MRAGCNRRGIRKRLKTWRRKRDSNPRASPPLTVFKTAGFNHSPIPPLSILPDSVTYKHCHYSFAAFFQALGTTVTILSLVDSLPHGIPLGFVVRVSVAHGHVTVECPSSSFTVTRSVPLRVSREAKVCRNVCHVMPDNRARLMAPFKPSFTS